jgi:hypothetical protein
MKELIAQYKPYLSAFGDNPYIQSLAILLIALLSAKILDLIIRRVLKRWAEKTKNGLDNGFKGSEPFSWTACPAAPAQPCS